MASFYRKFTNHQQIGFLFICFSAFGALASLFFLLLPEVGIGGFLGYLLGAGVALANYFLLVVGYRNLLSENGPRGKTVAIGLVFMFLRYALDAGALILAAFSTFKWGSHFLHFWFVFAAMLPIYPILIVHTLMHKEGKNQ